MVDELPKRKSIFQSKMMMDSLVYFQKIVLNQVPYLALLKIAYMFLSARGNTQRLVIAYNECMNHH